MRENNLLRIFLKLPIIITLPLISCFTIATKTNAQITPDNTLGNENSIVTPGDVNGLPSDIITGGATRGGNLFHSFQDFNVFEGRGAFFENPAGIFNILNRVTGNNISEILGTLGVLGDANLFFINPNGIIFGENASLNVNGSVAFSTADSVVFDNGFEFSASNPEVPPLLTINIPIGLGLRDNLGILDTSGINEASPTLLVNSSNITVTDSTILDSSLLHGDIFISDLVLESISEDTNLILQADNDIIIENLDYNAPDKDVSLVSGENIFIDNSTIDVSGNGSGSVEFKSNGNINIINSNILAGIGSENIGIQSIGENILIDATGAINIDESTLIANQVNMDAIGNSGDILIDGASFKLSNVSVITTSALGEGDSGKIIIDIADNIEIDSSGIFSLVAGKGNTGGIEISSNTLNLTNNSTINNNIFQEGIGNSGLIEINTNHLTLNKEASINSNIIEEGVGNTGGIEISSNSLNLMNGGLIDASIFGVGNTGRIIIEATEFVEIDGESEGIPSTIGAQILSTGEGNTGGIELKSGSLSITNGGVITTTTGGEGDSGSIVIEVKDFVVIDGENSLASDNNNSNINNQVFSTGKGNSGGIQLSSDTLELKNGGNISASTLGDGNSGNIIIEVRDSVVIDGEDSQGNSSFIESAISASGVTGNSGSIEFKSGSLRIANGGKIGSSTLGLGNSGLILIEVTDFVVIDGENSQRSSSRIDSIVGPNGVGNSEGIELRSSSLSITNGGFISTSTLGLGNTGEIIIDVTNFVRIDGESTLGIPSFIDSQVEPIGIGNSGGIQLTTNSLTLSNEGAISATTAGDGNAGDINITESETIILESGSEITTEIIGFGISNEPSNINISSSNLILNDAEISATTSGFGDGGNIEINLINDGNFDDSFITVNAENEDAAGNISLTADNLNFNNTTITTETVSGEGGDIVINTNSLLNLSNNSPLTTNAGTIEGPGNGGDITINTEFLRASEDSDITANANEGNGGSITITAFGIFLGNDIDITATSEFGEFGEIETNTPDIDPSDGLIDLSQKMVDGSDLIANNFCDQRNEDSEYIVTGTGGFPPNPIESLNISDIEVGLIPLREDLNIPETVNSSDLEENKVEENKIEPALGWVKNEKGEVVLVNYIPTIETYHGQQPSNTTCQPR